MLRASSMLTNEHRAIGGETGMVGLNDLQRKMLHAMHAGKLGVLRISKVGPDVVQVTVGEQRWFGKSAVGAVMNLMIHGLLTRVAGQHYELTDQGMRMAVRLPGTASAPRQRSTTCPRCSKRLVRGCARCSCCGARIAAAPTSAAPEA